MSTDSASNDVAVVVSAAAALIGAINGLPPLLTYLQGRRESPRTQASQNTVVTPHTAPITTQEPTRAIAPWATLAFGLLSLAVAFGAVGLRLANTSTDIAALRIVASALCLPAAAIGWRTLRKTPTSDAEENNVLVAGAGLLAGVFVGLMMLLLT